MWPVLSGDFDAKFPAITLFANVLLNAGPGSIIVFDDSTKAWERMSWRFCHGT